MSKNKEFTSAQIQAALNVTVQDDSGDLTLKEYLICLLETVWDKKERFDGKRPFGNSAWYLDVFYSLCRAGLIDGEKNEDGEVYKVDEKQGEAIVIAAIKSLLKPQESWKKISKVPPVAIKGRDILFIDKATGLYHLCKNGALYGYAEYTNWMPIPPLPEDE